jgi:hypothetical protein
MGYESIGIEIDPQYFDVGWLILGPLDPVREDFQRTAESFRSFNNLD